MESARIPAQEPSGLWGWLDDRLGLGGIRYPVPRHANSLAFTLGGVTLVSFVPPHGADLRHGLLQGPA